MRVISYLWRAQSDGRERRYRCTSRISEKRSGRASFSRTSCRGLYGVGSRRRVRLLADHIADSWNAFPLIWMKYYLPTRIQKTFSLNKQVNVVRKEWVTILSKTLLSISHIFPHLPCNLPRAQVIGSPSLGLGRSSAVHALFLFYASYPISPCLFIYSATESI